MLHKNILLIFCCASLTVIAQTNIEIAKQKAQEAEKFEAKGDVLNARKLLFEATNLDSSNINYPLRIAKSYSREENHKTAIVLLEKLTEHKHVNDVVFQELGNNYHYNGSSKKAIKAYNRGLKIFPNSGKLYCEIGNVHRIEKNSYKAIEFYEKAIEVEPTFLASYKRATEFYCIGTTVPFWGLVYGELFCNLSNDTFKLKEVGALLFRTFKYSIEFSNSSLSRIVLYDSLHDFQGKSLICGVSYQKLMRKSIRTETQIDLSTLNSIRTKFIDLYFNEQSQSQNPNVLFDYQKRLIQAGHFEAYNYWLFGNGDIVAFTNWKMNNQTKWDAFILWFKEHKIVINNDKKFCKSVCN